ncbi:MAG TPA: hypothetical protein VHB97_08745 [Polyangia bacterium]|nr:hypothetical protein [Polyangia bacterium]
MSRLRFAVESVVADRGIVLARPLDTGELRLTPHATLGVRPVRHFDLPRTLRADGTPDFELVGFFLRNSGDVVHFPVGAVVVYADE